MNVENPCCYQKPTKYDQILPNPPANSETVYKVNFGGLSGSNLTKNRDYLNEKVRDIFSQL